MALNYQLYPSGAGWTIDKFDYAIAYVPRDTFSAGTAPECLDHFGLHAADIQLGGSVLLIQHNIFNNPFPTVPRCREALPLLPDNVDFPTVNKTGLDAFERDDESFKFTVSINASPAINWDAQFHDTDGSLGFEESVALAGAVTLAWSFVLAKSRQDPVTGSEVGTGDTRSPHMPNTTTPFRVVNPGDGTLGYGPWELLLPGFNVTLDAGTAPIMTVVTSGPDAPSPGTAVWPFTWIDPGYSYATIAFGRSDTDGQMRLQFYASYRLATSDEVGAAVGALIVLYAEPDGTYALDPAAFYGFSKVVPPNTPTTTSQTIEAGGITYTEISGTAGTIYGATIKYWGWYSQRDSSYSHAAGGTTWACTGTNAMGEITVSVHED